MSIELANLSRIPIPFYERVLIFASRDQGCRFFSGIGNIVYRTAESAKTPGGKGLSGLLLILIKPTALQFDRL